MNLYIREDEINLRRRHISRDDRSLEEITEDIRNGTETNLKWLNGEGGFLTVASHITVIESDFLPKGIWRFSVPGHVKRVDDYAFADLPELEMLDIRTENCVFGEDLFWGSGYLTSIILPKALMETGQELLGRSGWYEKRSADKCLFDEMYSIEFMWQDYGGQIEDYIIRDGEEVRLRENAFDYGAFDAELPGDLTEIGESAFCGTCIMSIRLELPFGVKRIGKSAFESCRTVKEIILPPSVTDIAEEAFSGCWDLETIVLPEGLSYLADKLFAYCENLRNIIFPDNLKVIGENVFQSCTFDTLYLPGKTEIIGKSVFSYCTIQELHLPDSVEVIENDAFYNASIGQLNIPAELKKIGYGVFERCSLDRLIFPDNGLSVMIGQETFQSAGKLPEFINFHIFSEKTIEARAYYGMDMEKAEIPASVQEIGGSAFGSCEELREVTFAPESELIRIENRAFGYCPKLERIILPETLKFLGDEVFIECKSLKKLDLPDAVEEMETSVFLRCHELERVKLPKNITVIGWQMFESCRKLTSITFPEHVKEIGAYAFCSCESLCMSIPEDVEKIGKRAFAFSGIKEAIIPTGISVIEESTFRGCRQLRRVAGSEGLKQIKRAAFLECEQLKLVELPEGLKTIGAEAFANCTALEEIIIPDTVTTIEAMAFSNCSSLRRISVSDQTKIVQTPIYDSHDVPVDDGQTAVMYWQTPDENVSEYQELLRKVLYYRPTRRIEPEEQAILSSKKTEEKSIMLNPEQTQAVKCTEGPVMIISCAGAGKTTVILERVKHLVELGNPPEKILVTTFSRAAASDMRKRFEEAYDIRGVKFSTIHALCRIILTGAYFYDADFVLSDEERIRFFHEQYKQLKATEDFAYFYTDITSQISKYEIKQYTETFQKGVTAKEQKQVDGNDFFEYMYHSYQAYKKANGKLDFDDLLIEAHRVLTEREIVRMQWQGMLDHIMIDEYQDTSLLQAEIFFLLAGDKRNLCVVGDDDQSIYSFRGTQKQVFDLFMERYPDTNKLFLNINYRSREYIIRAADRLIRHNTERMEKELNAVRKEPGKISVVKALSRDNQAFLITQGICHLLQSGKKASDIAILYRKHGESYALGRMLQENEISFYRKESLEETIRRTVAGNGEQRSTNPYGEDKQGVFLGTFHAAKGLEWKYVFIISANQGITPLMRQGEIPDLEEERRLFYVAVTRARDLLMIITIEERNNDPDSTVLHKPSVFLEDMGID